jgi:hypothetical protein
MPFSNDRHGDSSNKCLSLVPAAAAAARRHLQDLACKV